MKSELMVAVLLIRTATAAMAVTARVFRVHDVGFANLDTIADLAKTALSEGSRLAVDAPRRRLLIWATESEHSQIAELTRVVAAPPPMVRIEVHRRAAGRLRELAFEAGMAGTVVASADSATENVVVRPRIQSHAGDSTEELVQTITVLSGRSASLQIGEEVPYLEWLQQCAVTWGMTLAAVRWRAVGASLAVKPTVIGQGPSRRILIRLVPELSGVSETGPLRWRFERVATELVVTPGETVQFSGSSAHVEFYDRFMVGIRRGGRHDNIELRLTPTVLDALPTAGGEHSERAVGR